MDAAIALGGNAHLFARPGRRQDLARCFETVLGCRPAAAVEHPAMPEPVLLITFPGGGHLSIEFTASAPDDHAPRLGAWLEPVGLHGGRPAAGRPAAGHVRADDPAATKRAVLDAGLVQVQHPGHPYCCMAPGGQVFTIVPARTRPSQPAGARDRPGRMRSPGGARPVRHAGGSAVRSQAAGGGATAT